MCVGIPMRITSCDGLMAHGEGAEGAGVIDLALTGSLKSGTWVLCHLGAAREVITEEDAHLIEQALAGLRDIMGGGDGAGAFADLDAREPQLPPHLEAARRAGQSVG